MLSVSLSIMLRALLVEPVLALCLSQFIDLGSSETNEEFLGELVGNRLAYHGHTFVSYLQVSGGEC